MAKLLPLTFVIALLAVYSNLLVAQENVLPQKKSVSDDFEKARQLAFDGKREEARNICSQILKDNPEYSDAKILIGRTLAWDKKYPEARKEFLEVLDADFDNRDVIFALIDVEKWSGDLSKALFYCDYGQSFYPAEEKFLIEKIKLQQRKGLKSKALQAINELLELNPASIEGNELFKRYKSASGKYALILKHDFEHFEEPYIRRWHVSSLQLAKRNPWGSIIGKINIGDLVLDGESLWSSDISKQFELEAYPRISSSNYMYLNYGYSPDDMFPQHRAGAEWFQKLPSKFEASAGIRFLKPGTDHKNRYIYTGSLGKYYRNYWFSLRGYFTPKHSDIFKSYLLITRRYLRGAKQYIGLELGTGTSPDETRGNIADVNAYKYDSWKIRLAYQDQIIDRRLTYLLRAGFEKEEYKVKERRRILTLSVKLSYRL